MTTVLSAILVVTSVAARESNFSNVVSESNGQNIISLIQNCVPPFISVQPISLSSVRRGSSQTLSVEAAGTAPLTYQWYKTGYPAAAVGTNSGRLTIENVGGTDAGYYYVIVTNECGKDTSKVISLTLEPTPKSSTVSCPSMAEIPAIIAVATHPCDGTITGVLESIVDTPNPIICEGTRTYTYSYTSKGGSVAYWTYTYTIRCSGELTAPANTVSTVSRLSEAVDPGPPADITDACGRKVSAELAGLSTPHSNEVVWTYRYSSCDCGTTADWTHTYTIDESHGTASTVSPATGYSSPVIIPDGFSPNGDGINDYFFVTSIDNYPDAKLLIYSGTSTLIYEQEHYGNSGIWGSGDAAWWNGTDKDKNKLDSGSYIYILDLDHGRQDLIKTGIVFINR